MHCKCNFINWIYKGYSIIIFAISIADVMQNVCINSYKKELHWSYTMISRCICLYFVNAFGNCVQVFWQVLHLYPGDQGRTLFVLLAKFFNPPWSCKFFLLINYLALTTITIDRLWINISNCYLTWLATLSIKYQDQGSLQGQLFK